MKFDILFVGKMADYILSEEVKESKVMTFCGMERLHRHPKCAFNCKLAFSMHLT